MLFEEMYAVNEYSEQAVKRISLSVDHDNYLKPGIPITDPEEPCTGVWAVSLDLIRNDAPLFMGFDSHLEIYQVLKHAGVIDESRLVQRVPEDSIGIDSLDLEFDAKQSGVDFVNRLNDFMHTKRNKFIEFLTYGMEGESC